MKSVGILGSGTYLPPIVRTNDWWPPHVVAKWHDKVEHRVTRAGDDAAAPSEGVRRTFAAMAEYTDDPFRGAVERRVMPDGMTSDDMEANAARDAMERASVRADEIDAILVQNRIPEYLAVNTACVTHRLLGLPQRCLAISTNVACNAFAHHVSIAQALVASGQARRVLSVHSSAVTRFTRIEDPASCWMGDGASAAVLGEVSDGRGILAAIHNADGSTSEALAFGAPGKPWWDAGRIALYSPNRDHTRAMLVSLLDRAAATIGDALAAAGVAKSDVGFYAAHQGMPWLARASAAHAGIEHARTLVTFPMFGNMSSVNVPLILAIAERERMLRDDSIVVTFAGGIGETWSSMVVRWGR